MSSKIFSAFILSMALTTSVYSTTPSSARDYSEYDNPQSLEQWKKKFTQKALKKGVKKSILTKHFAPLTLNPEIIEFDRRQPEFSKTFGNYISSALSKKRRATAKKQYRKHCRLLRRISKKYGVPARYLVAFWGLETNFGATIGRHNVLQSLATLSYDLRRQDFFEKELILALKIVQNKNVRADKFIGSWAGAFGQMQFMPSTFTAYAVDYNRDGRKDLWYTPGDYFASAANFLRKIGWDKSKTWGREVSLRAKNIPWHLVNKKRYRTLGQWHKMGVRAYGLSLRNKRLKARLVMPAGVKGPRFLVYKNFDVILGWNNSSFYALAVGLLANDIAGKRPMRWKVPKNEKTLSTDEIKNIQLVLQEKGYYSGTIDGMFGTESRNAFKQFQKDIGFTPDGYLNQEVFEKIKEYLQ